MVRPSYPSDDVEKLLVRFPEGMRERIKMAAEINGRSMNSEIILRLSRSLEESVDERVKLDLPGDLWNALMTDAAVNGVNMDERAIQILNGAYDPDSTVALDKVRAMAMEISDLQGLVAQLTEKENNDFLLYHSKLLQLGQLVRLIENAGDAVPENIRVDAEELGQSVKVELQRVRKRHDDYMFFEGLREHSRRLEQEIEDSRLPEDERSINGDDYILPSKI